MSSTPTTPPQSTYPPTYPSTPRHNDHAIPFGSGTTYWSGALRQHFVDVHVVLYSKQFGRYGSWFDFPKGIEDRLRGCRNHPGHCHVTYNLSGYERADALVFFGPDTASQFKPADLLKLRKTILNDQQKWVFYNSESPTNSPNYDSFTGLFNLTMTYRLDSDIKSVYSSYTMRDDYYIDHGYIRGMEKGKWDENEGFRKAGDGRRMEDEWAGDIEETSEQRSKDKGGGGKIRASGALTYRDWKGKVMVTKASIFQEDEPKKAADMHLPGTWPVKKKWMLGGDAQDWEPSLWANKSKEIVWFVSNCGGVRERLARYLGRFFQVDIYGKCVGRPVSSARERTEIIRQYKFYLAFENSFCPDYITEKYWNTLGHSVPIIFGPTRLASMVPYSYIRVEDFDRLAGLVEYLRFISGHEIEYNAYLAWTIKYEVAEWLWHREHWTCLLCDHIRSHANKNSLANIMVLTSPTTCITPSIIKDLIREEKLVEGGLWNFFFGWIMA